jgi:hypothetical protein
MGRQCYLFFIPMASFQDFKDKALTGVVAFAFGMMWYDIREMKNDLKTLIAQTSESRTKIEALERQVYKTSVSLHKPVPPYKLPKQVDMREVVAIINKNDLNPKEDETFN